VQSAWRRHLKQRQHDQMHSARVRNKRAGKFLTLDARRGQTSVHEQKDQEARDNIGGKVVVYVCWRLGVRT